MELTGTGPVPGSNVRGGGLFGQDVADGESVEVNGKRMAFALQKETFTDNAGKRWKHSFWALYDGKGTVEDLYDYGTGYIAAGFYNTTATFTVDQDAVLVRFYEEDTSEPVEPEEVELSFKWNETMDNLKPGENVLLTADQAAALPEGAQVTVDENVPAGWKLDGVETREDGSVVATLSLDESALTPQPPEGQSTPLTIVNNADGTVTVEATVANGLRGFWYSLYTAPTLSGEWKVVASGEYESGTPSVQMTETEGEVKLSIIVDPSEASRFYKLVISSSDPSES